MRCVYYFFNWSQSPSPLLLLAVAILIIYCNCIYSYIYFMVALSAVYLVLLLHYDHARRENLHALLWAEKDFYCKEMRYLLHSLKSSWSPYYSHPEILDSYHLSPSPIIACSWNFTSISIYEGIHCNICSVGVVERIYLCDNKVHKHSWIGS